MSSKKFHINPEEGKEKSKIRIKGTGAEQSPIKIRSKSNKSAPLSPRQQAGRGLFFRKPWLAGGLAIGLIVLLAVIFWPREAGPSVVEVNPETTPEKSSSNQPVSIHQMQDAYVLQGDLFFVVQNAPLPPADQLVSVLSSFEVPQERQQYILSYVSLQANQEAQARYVLLARADSKKPVRFVLEPTEFIQTVFDLEQAGSDGVTLPRTLTFETQVLYGLIDQEIWDPLLNYPMGNRLMKELEEILISKVNFYRVKPGDQYKLIYKAKVIDGNIRDVSAIEAIHFKPQQGPEVFAFSFQEGAIKGYFDEEGRTLKQTFWRAPVKFAQVSSQFGMRYHPTEEEQIFHRGVDFAARMGTPIYAVADGTILQVLYDPHLNGRFVKMKHGPDYVTFYLHMQRFHPGIRPNAFVRQGDTLGYVGNTGRSTGPHVCFHLRYQGKPIDSQTAPLPQPQPLSDKYLPAFRLRRDSLQVQLSQIRRLSLP